MRSNEMYALMKKFSSALKKFPSVLRQHQRFTLLSNFVDLLYFDIEELIKPFLDEIVALIFWKVYHCLIFRMDLLKI